MVLAVLRSRWLRVGLTAFVLGALGAAAAPRAVPTRPGVPVAAAIATRKFDGVDYVNIADVAARLDLKLAWLERGHRVALRGSRTRAELEGDTRDITVNGMRVFLGDPVEESKGELFVSRIDFERCLAPMLRAGYGVTPLAPPKVVVLDPGHGGKDQGTSVNEKTFALDVALRAKKLLEAAGYRVVLTREGDTYVDLAQRAALANARRADLFVSIHFNALVNDTKTSGVEVYTFAPQHQRSAPAWSPGAKDDTEDFASPGNQFDHWNVVLAHAIQQRFVNDLKVFDRGKKLMHLGVLRPLRCPGMLVECGFLTSETEARKIATPAYRQQLAATIAAGIRDYGDTLQGLSGGPRSAAARTPRAKGRAGATR
jgi:N-acetylmuramoyl-L-alanine amidase